MWSSSIWPTDRTLSGATTPGQSELGSNGNEGVLCIPPNSSITGVSRSDCLVSYPGHSLGESYPFAEMQLVYSTAQTDWEDSFKLIIMIILHKEIKLKVTIAKRNN